VQRMEELLARARAADADVARVREGASPAGDPDPYRVSGAEQDDESAPGDDAGRVAARAGGTSRLRGRAEQLSTGAPTANGEGAGDDDELED
jgi:hypothetical protein